MEILLVKLDGFGRATATQIDKVLGEFIDPSSVLVTDTATNFIKLRPLSFK